MHRRFRGAVDFVIKQGGMYLPPRAKNSCESTTGPLISHLSDLLQRTMHISLTASLLSFRTFFRNQQAVVGNLLKILVDVFWPRTSVLLDALERKQPSLEMNLIDILIDTSIPRGEGVLHIMAYTGRLRPKGVPFSGFRYVKG